MKNVTTEKEFMKSIQVYFKNLEDNNIQIVNQKKLEYQSSSSMMNHLHKKQKKKIL